MINWDQLRKGSHKESENEGNGINKSDFLFLFGSFQRLINKFLDILYTKRENRISGHENTIC